LRGTFFTVDLADARDALRRVPWIRSVSVRRQWPGRLAIAIEEHRPLARWNDTALINLHGEVFDAEYGEELPDFYGPEGTAGEVAARYREFAAPLRTLRLGIDALSRSARGAWEVKLDDGLTIALGREQVSERWARWMQVSERYRDRIAQGGVLAAIDMRYANGFAARIAGGANGAADAKAAPAKRG
jgi:cell division protein FtsQ